MFAYNTVHVTQKIADSEMFPIDCCVSSYWTSSFTIHWPQLHANFIKLINRNLRRLCCLTLILTGYKNYVHIPQWLLCVVNVWLICQRPWFSWQMSKICTSNSLYSNQGPGQMFHQPGPLMGAYQYQCLIHHSHFIWSAQTYCIALSFTDMQPSWPDSSNRTSFGSLCLLWA